MASSTVQALAQEMKVTAQELLKQLRSAGIDKNSETDSVTEADKAHLVEFLRQDRQAKAKKITLTRKETTTVKQADGQHTVKVEVRRKRVLMKNPATVAREQAIAAERALNLIAERRKLTEIHRVGSVHARGEICYRRAAFAVERDSGLVVSVVCNGAVGERIKRTLNGTVSIVSDFKGCFQRSVA